jgi:hypothetical protein
LALRHRWGMVGVPRAPARGVEAKASWTRSPSSDGWSSGPDPCGHDLIGLASKPTAPRRAGEPELNAVSLDGRGHDGARAPDPSAVVDVRGLRKSFGTLEVLKGISFTVRQGDVLSVIGASGSRQEHAPALRQSPGAAHLERDLRRWPAHGLPRRRPGAPPARLLAECQPPPPGDWHGVPAVQPVTADDSPRQRHGGSAARAEAVVHKGSRRRIVTRTMTPHTRVVVEGRKSPLTF